MIGTLPDLSDEATRGLAVARHAVGAGESKLVRGFVEGSVVTAARADLSLSNVNRLQGVNGLDKMVKHLKTSRNNTDGIDGVVFEGTVARRLLDGEVPGSGALNEVTADGLKSANKIDTLTESWAIQIKHKTTVPPNYGPEQLGGQSAAEAYLNQLVAQAASQNIQRVPLFITNCPITSGFQDMLTQRGILWQQVAP